MVNNYLAIYQHGPIAFHFSCSRIKIKVEFAHEEATKVQKGVEVYIYSFFSLGDLDGGGWSKPSPGRFTLGKDSVPIVQEAGWAPGPVWTGAENLAPSPGFDLRTFQPLASRYTD